MRVRLNIMTEQKPKRGRPVGSIPTPRSVLQQDMREAIRLNRQMRELLGAQLTEIEKALQQDGSLAIRLKVVEALSAALSSQSKAVDGTAKHVINGEEDEGKEIPSEISDLFKGN
jgi:hypothetical protein